VGLTKRELPDTLRMAMPDIAAPFFIMLWLKRTTTANESPAAVAG